MAGELRSRRLPAALAAAALGLSAGFALPVPALGLPTAVLAAAFPLGLIALGARRRGRLGPIGGILLALLAVLEGSWLAIVAASAGHAPAFAAGGALGLPPGAWAQLVGLFFLPLVLVSLGYALTFDRWGIRQEDLERLKRLRAGTDAVERPVPEP